MRSGCRWADSPCGSWRCAIRSGLPPSCRFAAAAIRPGAAKLTGLPVLAVHGSADTVVPVRLSREMVRAIWNAGGENVVYQELPLCGHDAWTPAFRCADNWKWLFAQQNQQNQ